ncbi:MAG TPA: hypothetical protein VEC36_02580, partial [Patescibacteria group bacterium]|nr:hypothetical protein [Patescibacteria group bacterium]
MSNSRHSVFFPIPVLIIAAFLLCFFKAGAQELRRRTVIDSVVVEGRKVTQEDLQKEIIASSTENIEFWYSCKSDTGEITSNVLFRVKIRDGGAENVSTQNPPKVFKLSQGRYRIGIQAHQPAHWKTDYTTIIVKIDDKQAAKIREEQRRRDSIAQAAALPAEETIENIFSDTLQTQNQTSQNTYLLGIIIAIAVLVIPAIVFVKRKTIFSPRKNIPEKAMAQQSYEDLLSENGALKAELAALRGQFEALQSRGEEIQRQNKELEEKVEKISSKKNELEELQAQKDDLFAMIIHDIKNPASLI